MRISGGVPPEPYTFANSKKIDNDIRNSQKIQLDYLLKMSLKKWPLKKLFTFEIKVSTLKYHNKGGKY